MAADSKTLKALGAILLIAAIATLPAREQSPRRIISLIPAATEMLFAIGASPRVVAVGSYDRYPPEATKLPTVGALIDPNVERILSLKPDLVVIYASQTDLKRQLVRAGRGHRDPVFLILDFPRYAYPHRSLVLPRPCRHHT